MNQGAEERGEDVRESRRRRDRGVQRMAVSRDMRRIVRGEKNTSQTNKWREVLKGIDRYFYINIKRARRGDDYNRDKPGYILQ